MAGLTATGFEALIQSEIHDDLKAAARAAFGANAGVGDDEFFGRLFAILAERYALLWELAEAAYNAQDVDAAIDAALIAICALTGTIPKSPAPSTTTLTLTGEDATVVAVGSQASVETTGKRFETSAEGTLAALDAWASATAYVVGDRVTNGGNAYICTVAGTSAGSGGPTTESEAIADNTVTWRYMGEGVAAVDVAAESIDNGEISGASGTINTIETTIAGWEGVINLEDATLGTAEESNSALRLRREDEIAKSGSGTVDAARAKLLALIPDVENVKGFWNHSDDTDADGVPPHAVEFLVEGGEDQDIFDALLAAVGGGIQTHGDVTGTATDSEGNAQPQGFSRADEQDIYVVLTVEYDSDYPEDGDDQIKAAIVAWGNSQSLGKDSVSVAVAAQCFLVTGVHNVTEAFIGLAPAPATTTTIPITTRQRAVYDTSRISITSSEVTP